MAKTWGSETLNILVGSLKTGGASGSLTETPLLANPSALNAISTVIQQQGRKRRKVNARLYVPAIADYEDFGADMDAGTKRTLTIDLTNTSGTYMIESLGDPEFIPHDIIFFDIVWVEA